MAILTTSYDVESGVKTTLKNTISPTQTSNIQINYALTITAGVFLFDGDTSRSEYISFGGATVASGVSTLADVTRNLSKTANDFSGTGTGSQHSGGACVVELTNYHALYNKKANTDRANSFTASQTIAGTNRLFLNDSSSWIYDNGTDIVFRSSAQSEVSLATLAAAAGLDERAKVSAADTNSGYLGTKIVANNGLVSSIGSPAGNETLVLDLDLATNPGLEFSGGQLRVRILAGGGIVRDANGLSVDQAANYSWTGTHNFSGATVTSMEAISLVDNGTFNDTIAQNAPVAVHGDGQFYPAQADVLNDCFTMVGTARQSGTAGQSRKINFFGPVLTISSLTPTQGREWTGQSQATSNSTVAVASTTWLAQTFTPAAGETRVDKIRINITKTGSGADTTVAIRATSGGLPTGADLAAVTLTAANTATGDNDFSGFNLTVTPGTVYAIVVSCPSGDGSNNSSWSFQNTNVYSGGQRADSTNSGSSWVATASNDMRFTIFYNNSAGSEVFLRDDGSLGLQPGTYFQKVGKALSDTKMILQNHGLSIYATYSYNTTNATVDTVISLGFRPKAVFAWNTSSNGFWHHGMSGLVVGGFCHWTQYSTGGGASLEPWGGSGEFLLWNRNYNDTQRSRITVQDTGPDSITIRRTVVGTVSDTVYLAIFG